MARSDLGETLRHSREARGLSLDTIARRTNIAPHVLAAIERGALTEIPGGLFARSYMRAYAREVGLDGERLIRDYLESSESDAEVLDHLRARFGNSRRGRQDILRLVLVIVGLTCLVYLFASDAQAAAGQVLSWVQKAA